MRSIFKVFAPRISPQCTAEASQLVLHFPGKASAGVMHGLKILVDLLIATVLLLLEKKIQHLAA